MPQWLKDWYPRSAGEWVVLAWAVGIVTIAIGLNVT